jgi:hypothetical protein
MQQPITTAHSNSHACHHEFGLHIYMKREIRLPMQQPITALGVPAFRTMSLVVYLYAYLDSTFTQESRKPWSLRPRGLRPRITQSISALSIKPHLCIASAQAFMGPTWYSYAYLQTCTPTPPLARFIYIYIYIYIQIRVKEQHNIIS